ncbi:MAG: YggS family pyridoxal phosphate-dependent enzyme [Flavobacteriales bacterium]|nr:YggS family pyridoxal phosphate-dependent enzyme [Flavobacteriales bacterium]
MSIANDLRSIKGAIPEDVTLIAVSKTRSIEEIKEAYDAGQRDMGENRVQELCSKVEQLPKDIRWHLIGHLQSNKVKYIAPFVHLIHSIESFKLLKEVDKRARENKRVIKVLLQFHIAQEESKFGFSLEEVLDLIHPIKELKNIEVNGVMGMATFTDNEHQIKSEFRSLKRIYFDLKDHFGDQFNTISMGMSGDYELAIVEGSTMIRVGSKIFGSRNY